MSPPAPPDSVLLMRALGAMQSEVRGQAVGEIALCARLKWDLMRVIRVIARGVSLRNSAVVRGERAVTRAAHRALPH